MHRIASTVFLALAIATAGCAATLSELISDVTGSPPPNSSNAPPLPPPPQPAVWADTLYGRHPPGVGRLMGEVFSGGETKSCYYDSGPLIRVLEVPRDTDCPATVKAPLR